MTAKEYLLQVKRIGYQIKVLEDEIEELRNVEISVKSVWPDGQPRGSGVSDEVARVATKLADELSGYELELLELQSKLWRKRNEIIRALGSLQRPEHNRLLYLRYVQCATWEEIAEDMHYSEKWVRTTLHSDALEEFRKQFLEVPPQSML